MSRQYCTTCRYHGLYLNALKETVTVCRRHPPVVNTNLIPAHSGAVLHNQTVWPQVGDMDWCGDFEPELQ